MHAEKFKSHKFLLDLRGKAGAHSKCPRHNADLTAVNCFWELWPNKGGVDKT